MGRTTTSRYLRLDEEELSSDGQTGLGHYANTEQPSRVGGDLMEERVVKMTSAADLCFALVDSTSGVTLCMVLNKVARCWALVSLAWGPTFDIFFPMKVAIKGAMDAAGIKLALVGGR